MPLTKNYPVLGGSLPPQPRQMVSFADGDTISIVQPIRMLSCDTPEKEGFAGTATTAQVTLDLCATRLRNGFYSAVPQAMREYLLDRLDVSAASRHLRAGHGASARFDVLLSERLTLPNGTKRKVAVMPAGELIDTYGRLLAYFAPYYKGTNADPLPPIGDPRRHTLNLNMIAEGWAAFFPVYPAIGKKADFNLALAGAERAWNDQLGAWAQEGDKLLLGYEFRLCVKLARAATEEKGLEAFSRLCVDMRTDTLHNQFGFWQVPPPYRLWIWKDDRESAMQALNLNT
jgi:endonuclease YncB( thermonuclease family)